MCSINSGCWYFNSFLVFVLVWSHVCIIYNNVNILNLGTLFHSACIITAPSTELKATSPFILLGHQGRQMHADTEKFCPGLLPNLALPCTAPLPPALAPSSHPRAAAPPIPFLLPLLPPSPSPLPHLLLGGALVAGIFSSSSFFCSSSVYSRWPDRFSLLCGSVSKV